MVVSDAAFEELRTTGFARVPELIPAAAQAALKRAFPQPDACVVDPDTHARFGKSQFAGSRSFP